MSNKIITTAIALLFFVCGFSQIEVDRIEENYIAEPSSTQIVIEAARSVTIKPNSHLKSGSNITIQIDENAYIPPTFTTGNYVFSRSYQTELTNPDNISALKDVIEKITYYDGLGRASQDIEVKFTPDRYDLIKPMSYDVLGRESKEYLPYKALGDNAAFHSDAISEVNSFYVSNYPNGIDSGSPNPFSEKKFEDGVLNRILKLGSPGYTWRLDGGNEVEYDYKLNDSQDAIRYFKVDFVNNDTQAPQLAESGTYGINQLTREITRDENHSGTSKNHTTEEFKDKRGRVILKRTYANVSGTPQNHDTYYVYDDFSNLTYVIPPEASENSTISTTILNALCFQYKYDEKNRMIAKKLPGKGGPNNYWETIVYNKYDQPILTQDPNLKATDAWLFTKYDALGRIAYTGKMVRDVDRATLQAEANLASETFVVRKSAIQIGGTAVEYNNVAFPINNITDIHTIHYYDDYNFNTEGLSVPSTVYGEAKTSNTTDLPTGSRIRVLGTAQNVYSWVTTVIGYDKKARVIYEAQKTPYLGTTDSKESKLDFTDRTLEAKTTHQKTGKSDIVSVDVFEYDHMGRVLTQTQTLGGQTEVLISNSYDDLGQLESKETGGGLQTVDYAYNVRGWLKAINDPSNLGSDLFGFAINYNTQDHGGTALFDGNITETEWKTANDNTLRWYTYDYDALNRIAKGTSSDGKFDLGSSSVPITYDKNGNIERLYRKGHIVAQPNIATASDYGIMDDLTYTYSGNRLMRVSDAIVTPALVSGEFKDDDTSTAPDSSDDYTYDPNGNMISDTNKGITSISYNHLNLPTQVIINSDNITYIYDATGVKLKKTVSTGGTTEYASNYIYEDPGSGLVLQFFNHGEGYIEPNGSGSYDYVYNYTDHLGNVRLSYTDNNGTAEIVKESNYYPFGLEHKGYNFNINGVENNYLTFQGKEHDKSLGLEWHDFGARNYDAALGRWMNLDPLAEDMRRHSPYNFAFNNPIRFIDPDGMAPFDWFENQEGKVVWFDNTSENFTSENGDEWQNIGTNLEEVEESLNVPENQNAEWNDLEFVTLGGAQGNGKGAFTAVLLESSAQVSFDLNVENTGDSGLERIDGETEITGVNLNISMTTETVSPIKLTGLGGSFGIKKWTPLGKINVNDSGSFQHTPMLSNYQSHASGKASLSLGLSTFRNMSRNIGNGGSFNIGVNSTATFKLEQNGRKGFFSTSNTITIR